ncbi:MAG: lipoprotein-releasing ABC transporter permease subunit [Magnetococcales bacterium]|nr:lipoprotein-releasing ABC transporter permease subunit [Magnetococcales bacterium]
MFLRHRYEWLVGLRYLRAKKSQHFIGVITLISVGGVSLGVAALIVVLAVMTGFKEELQRQILGVTSHVVIQYPGGRLPNHESLLAKVARTPNVVAASPYILQNAMLLSGNIAAGVVIRGIDPEREKEISSLARNLKRGSMDALLGYGIILGHRLAANLGVKVGQPVTVVAPVGNITALGTMPRMKRFRVVGVFDSGMYEYDKSLAYIHLNDAQTFFRFDDNVTGIEILTANPDTASATRLHLEQEFQSEYYIQDWMQMNHNFFRALQIEKATMFVILFLIVLVAAFNIISSLIMVVMEKGRDVAILKTMGATQRGIMTIFVINGGVIGLAGTLMGTMLGLALAFNLEPVLQFIERQFGIRILSGDVYFIDHLPSVVLRSDVIMVTTISLSITLLATLYPAWRAARVDPVETLRHE